MNQQYYYYNSTFGLGVELILAVLLLKMQRCLLKQAADLQSCVTNSQGGQFADTGENVKKRSNLEDLYFFNSSNVLHLR